jgi:hypothetical protein
MLVLALSAGCATPRKAAQPVIEKDVSRIVKLADGTTCEEPAGLGEARETDAAIALRALLLSTASTEDALARAAAIKLGRADVEAVHFDACRAYSNGLLTRADFEQERKVYLGLRQQLLMREVKAWQDKKEGIAEAGKLCLVSLPGTDPDHRSFTRVVPADTTVGDCAGLATANGASEILLGCTEGHWKNTWAKRPIPVNPKTGGRPVRGSAFAPEPDCGWN